MYDPNSALEQQRILDEIVRVNEQRKESMGPDHPLIGIFKSFYKALEILKEMTEDCDNCFDEERKQGLVEGIKEKIKELQSLNNVLLQAFTN